MIKADGRTCGWGLGTVNGVLADIWVLVALSVPNVVMMSSEWVVISRTEPNTDTLTERGDSGSLFVAHSSDAPVEGLNAGLEGLVAVCQMFGGGKRVTTTDTKTWELSGFYFTAVTPITTILGHLSEVFGENIVMMC